MVLKPSAAVKFINISMASAAAGIAAEWRRTLDGYRRRRRDRTRTVRNLDLDALVAGPAERVDGLEHRPLVRGRGLDVVVCRAMTQSACVRAPRRVRVPHRAISGSAIHGLALSPALPPLLPGGTTRRRPSALRLGDGRTEAAKAVVGHACASPISSHPICPPTHPPAPARGGRSGGQEARAARTPPREAAGREARRPARGACGVVARGSRSCPCSYSRSRPRSWRAGVHNGHNG